MTRSFNEKIRCPRCNYEHTAETDFERWMRNHQALDSRDAAVVRFDIDILLHKYKFGLEDGKGTRDIQCLMFIEVKTFMAQLSEAQQDTLTMLNDVLRNRQPNIHSTPRPQSPGAARKVRSKMLGREIRLQMYGGHLLQLDGSSPDNSSSIFWDYKQITSSQLVELLRFDRDPDHPERTLDHRRRSYAWQESPRLFPA